MDANPPRYFVVSAVLLPDNRLLLQPGYLVDHAEPAVPDDPESPVRAELVDGQGRILLRQRLAVSPFCADGGQVDGLMVVGKIPFPAGTRSVRFYRDDVLLRDLPVPTEAPRVRFDWRPQEPAVGVQIVTWRGSHPQRLALTYVLRYAHADERPWQPLAVGLTEPRVDVDFGALPGGEVCRLSVMATDGVNTVVQESAPFRVPVKPCVATILSPEDGAEFRFGQRVPLQGQGYYLEENAAELQDLSWDSDRDGRLGRGAYVEAAGLSPGAHRITLVAGAGERAGRADVGLHVTPNG